MTAALVGYVIGLVVNAVTNPMGIAGDVWAPFFELGPSAICASFGAVLAVGLPKRSE